MPKEKLDINYVVHNVLEVFQTLKYIHTTLTKEVNEFYRIFKQENSLEDLHEELAKANEYLNPEVINALENFIFEYNSANEVIEDLNKQVDTLNQEKKLLIVIQENLEQQRDKAENEIEELKYEVELLQRENESLKNFQ